MRSYTNLLLSSLSGFSAILILSSLFVTSGPFQVASLTLVPGGYFTKGLYPTGENEANLPKTYVDTFYIGRFEVTNREFVRFLNQQGIQEIGGAEWYDTLSNDSKILPTESGSFAVVSGYRDHPVETVSWFGAISYCNWLSQREGLEQVYGIWNNGDSITVDFQANGYRLPRENEWEYAARSRSNTELYSGTSLEDELPNFGNFCDTTCVQSIPANYLWDGYPESAPVGRFSGNSLGLHDMSGNVWEWCTDSWTRSIRIIRGGSWRDLPRRLKCISRSRISPNDVRDDIGFRLSRSFPNTE